jgi:DNA-binding LacI/PurR family transcriptional regulator
MEAHAMAMASTIRDVARLAGVSTATVSRVVNGHGAIRAETAQRVQAAIETLGFRPSAVGRSLKTARTRTFGVMIPSLSNPIFAATVGGVEEAARAAGYSVLITASDYHESAEVRAVDTMLSHQVEGLILTVADADASPLLNRLDGLQTPYVLLFNQPESKLRSAVTVDNVAAGRRVAEILARDGHRRLGMVAGEFRASDRSRARHRGFACGAGALGLPEPELVEVDFAHDQVAQTMAAMYRQPEPPTALFCSTDMLAISVMSGLRSLGLDVPGDVSVIGFDGIAIGRLIHPTLATVVQPSRDMGQAAVQRLLGRLTGVADGGTHLLPVTYRPGESVGPPSERPAAVLADQPSTTKLGG